MKKIFTFTWFLMTMFCIVNAQELQKNDLNSKISGKVVDSISRLTIEYATVTVFAKSGKKALNGTTTDKTGGFLIQGVDAGTYTIVVEFIGYKAITINDVSISKKNEVVDLRTIVLASKATTLQNVVVTSTGGRLIENKIDKLVFNAERDLTSQTGVATDILKKVPQVTVGIDGNVELAGSSSIRFLISGKPSSAFGSSITDVLNAIPASQIKSIEVITNPGAKYDAQGLGGIINIILKSSSAQGINGNLSLTGGTRMENGSFNFNARKGQFGINAFVSGNVRLNVNTPAYSERITNDTAAGSKILLHQDGVNRVNRNGYQTGIGFDWTYKEKNSFSGSFAYNHFGNNGDGYTNQRQEILAGGGASLFNFLSVNKIENAFRFYNVDANLNYKRTFNKEDQELEIALNTSNGNSVNTASNNQFALPQDSLYYSTNNRNPGSEKENELKIDYSQPLKKDIILGIGGKINFMDIAGASNVLRLNGATNNYEPAPFLNNNLDYHQKVYAVYSEIALPVSQLFDMKIGGRYERTEINAFYSNAQTQKAIPGYNTFVPSVYFSRKLDEISSVKLSYSKRIERPDYGELNPFINTSDPKNISTGNSNLKPEVGKRYELAYNRDLGKAGSFMVNFFYRLNENDIQPFIVFYPTYAIGDSIYTNVAVSTRTNIGTEKNVGVNLFGDVKLISKLSTRINLFFFHRNIINAVDKGYNINSYNYRFNLNAGYQFTNTLAAEFFGNFNSARNEAQGKYPSFTSYSIAVRKQFWNRNGSLALTATNPFKDAVDQRTELSGPNFIVNSNRSIPFRSIGINFTWKFGRLEFKKDKGEENNLNAPVE